MKLAEFLNLLEELLEMDTGSLKGDEVLTDLENWDSLSIVSFMGLAKSKFNLNLSAKSVSTSQNIDDLFRLISASPAS